jgi:hypothetical protein
LENKAKLWVLIGSLRLHFSIPTTDCDPIEKYKFKYQFLQNILFEIDCEKETLQRIEQMFTGRNNNWKISELVQEDRQIRDYISTRLKRKVPKKGHFTLVLHTQIHAPFSSIDPPSYRDITSVNCVTLLFVVE